MLIVAFSAGLAFFIYSNEKASNPQNSANFPQVAGANTSPCTPNLVVGADETFKTVEAAVNSLNNNGAGKVICVKNDKVYGPVPPIEASGSPTEPLVIKGHPENPVRSGTNRPVFRDEKAYPRWQDRQDPRFRGRPIISLDGENIILQDIEVARSALTGIEVGGYYDKNTRRDVIKRNYQLINVSVHDTYGDGIVVQYAQNVQIDNCDLYRNEMIGAVTTCMQATYKECDVGEVLKVRDSDSVTITNCSIREDMSRGRGGILNTNSSNTTYRNNEIYMSDGNLLHIGDASNVVMENNLVYANCGYRANGLYKLAERYPPDRDPYRWKGGSGYTIKNNLFVGMEKGLNFAGCEGYEERNGPLGKTWTAGHPCPFDNVLIENNTIVGTGNQDATNRRNPNPYGDEINEFAIIFSDMHDDPASNVRIRNNIFHAVEDGIGDGEDVRNELLGNDVIFSGNIFHDKNQLGQGDREVPNLAGIFPANPDLNNCFDGVINKNNYRVAGAYNGKGADVSKVGRNALVDQGGDDDPLDTDGDGVTDDIDVCDNVIAGTNPDPARPGCPMETGDRDGDGVNDTADQCPDTSQGPNPDSSRLGCPSDDAPITGSNILLNPTFSMPAVEEGEIARYWKASTGRLGNVSTQLINVTDTNLAQAKAIKMIIRQNPNVGNPAITQRGVNLEPNTTYEVSFVASASTTGRAIMFLTDLSLLQQALGPNTSFTLEPGWKLYSAQVTTKAFDPNKLARVSLAIKLPNSSNIVIDNIRVVPTNNE